LTATRTTKLQIETDMKNTNLRPRLFLILLSLLAGLNLTAPIASPGQTPTLPQPSPIQPVPIIPKPIIPTPIQPIPVPSKPVMPIPIPPDNIPQLPVTPAPGQPGTAPGLTTPGMSNAAPHALVLPMPHVNPQLPEQPALIRPSAPTNRAHFV
jgi:hypothetical protein